MGGEGMEGDGTRCMSQHTSIHLVCFKHLTQTLQHQFSCFSDGVQLLGGVGGEIGCPVC